MGRSYRRACGSVVALLLAGCAVDPPVPLEADPAYAGLALTSADRPIITIGVAPTIVFGAGSRWRGLDVATLDSASSATVDSDAVAAIDSAAIETPVVRADDDGPRLERREYVWSAPTIDAAALDARLAAVLGWTLQGSAPLVRLGPTHEVLRAAEAAGLDLFVQAEVTDARAAWVDRGGWVWWANFSIFYGLGVLPIVYVEDEVYEVALRAHVSVVDARSGRALLGRTFVGRDVRALNDPERGWDLGGFLFLHPYTLDDDDLAYVFDVLYPHASKDLERQVATWLRDELPGRLRDPRVRAGLARAAREGARGRTYALVIGANGPDVRSLDRPPPLAGAERDASAFARLLRASGEVGDAQVIELRGEAATSANVLDAVRRVGQQVTASDRLIIYYAGYGWFDMVGDASLLLGGEPLSLRSLTKRVASATAEGAEVVYLLDTSFGGVGGRTYPGAPTSPDHVLEPLSLRPTWHALVASQVGQSAHEDLERGGLFTAWLITGLRGAADADADEVVSVPELSSYVRDWVRSAAIEQVGQPQVPVHLGSGGPEARFLRVVTEDP